MIKTYHFPSHRFGATVQQFRKTLVKPTPKILQEAWSWVLNLNCEGSRNLMGGLRAALENEEERQHKVGQWYRMFLRFPPPLTAL